MNLTHSQYCHCECPDTSAMQRIRDLHKPVLNNQELVCQVCLADGGEEAMIYPCDTIIVLNGGDCV